MQERCLLILSVEMIFIFDGFADGQINKISKDGRCDALRQIIPTLSGAPGDCID